MAPTTARPADQPASIAAFGAGLRARDFSAREMTERALGAAGASQGSINAFITITAEAALAQAAAVDEALAGGRDSGPLMGVPVAVKDVLDIKGLPTTAGSRLFAGNIAQSSATAVARLLRGGAVIVGKTNMDQFAFGPHQDDFGRTNCPADTACYAGGSSGGSAAAVAAGIVLGALGSDAGGSTRFPAACCGVVGFKGTFGRVPTDGVFPTFWTLDHVGVLAGGVDDVSMLFAAIADRASAQPPLAGPPRLAVLDNWQRGCSSTVSAAIGNALAALAAAGADVRDGRQLAGMADCLPTLIATVGPEASVALESYLADAGDAVPAPLVELLAAARQQPATEYVAAQRVRGELRRAVDELLADADALVMPTSLDVAWRWAEIDAADMGVRDTTTLNLPLANLTGHPAISLPVLSDGLPVGLQLIGRADEDEHLLAVAAWLEHSLLAVKPSRTTEANA